MNLASEIDEQLYDEISSNYEKGDYTGAIIDSILYLNSIIRDRTSLQSDGVSLIGSAFGGNSPKLKITQMRTESERNIQKGTESILRGIIQAIRNPRSHEKYTDTVEDANAIIVFINYLLKQINKAKAPFSLEEYLRRVFDKDFVKNKQYADLLVNEIPKKKLFDVLMEIYNNKEEGDPHNLQFFFHSIFVRFTKEELDAFIDIISGELKTTDSDVIIRTIITVLGDIYWTNVDRIARIRIENKLVKSVSEGSFNKELEKCTAGVLGTWITNIYNSIESKDQLINSLTRKLASDNQYEQDYVFRFFGGIQLSLTKETERYLLETIRNGLESGDKRFYDAVFDLFAFGGPEWGDKIKEEFENFTEIEATNDDFHDDIPF